MNLTLIFLAFLGTKVAAQNSTSSDSPWTVQIGMSKPFSLRIKQIVAGWFTSIAAAKPVGPYSEMLALRTEL